MPHTHESIVLIYVFVGFLFIFRGFTTNFRPLRPFWPFYGRLSAYFRPFRPFFIRLSTHF